ncbi:hypothetical protein ACIQU5_02620 [Streptomyces sp. NPDC090306]|uniref:hypothetical protein n=1 Tax=Streptomyces sp. NPDC090306 TaxID=3365961 RepID=UPI0037F5DCA8
MDFGTLRQADLARLDAAVSDWEVLVAHLEDLRTDATDGLAVTAEKADWTGVNSQVAKGFVKKTAQEFTDAHTEARTIHNILKDTAGELRGFSGQLQDAIAHAERQNLAVFANGGGFTVTRRNPQPTGTADDDVPAGAEAAVRDEIQHILDKATQSDEGASRALQLVVAEAKFGFSDISAKDRDSADAAIDAAEKAEAIMRKDPSKVTNTELASLNASLAKYGGNSFFAEALATDLGAKKTLEFYAGITDDAQFTVNPRSGEGLSASQLSRMKLLGDLEKQLGTTLATASHSESDGMRQWKTDALALGGTDVRVGGGNPVRGFQVMSNLMRTGSYDTGFLDSYGNALVSYEKAHLTDEYGGLQRTRTRDDVLPWDLSGGYERLHYGAANDAGDDPMTGFMEALGHNAEASTGFFNEGDHFDYLTEDRSWFEDHTTSDAKNIAGYDSLGHALESATKGAPYDADPPVLHRDADTAAVAEKVVERYGQDAEYKGDRQTGLSGAQLLARQAGIGDSIGSIGAAYIDDIDWAMDDGDDLSVFAMDNGERASLGERAHFRQQSLDVSKFLSAVGQDPQGYAQVSTAQQAYTTSLLDAHPPTVDANGDINDTVARTALRTGAEVHGLMDHSRAEQIKAEGTAADAKYNEAVDDRIERNKLLTGILTGGAFALAPSPETGIAATIVPIATDQTESITGSQIEKNLDAYGESQHRDNSLKYHDDAAKVYERGYQSAWAPGRTALDNMSSPHAQFNAQYQTIREELSSAYQLGYTTGTQNNAAVGALPQLR